MMSVVNELDLSSVRIDEDNKRLYLKPSAKSPLLFPYSFMCKDKGVVAFFDMTKMIMVLIVKNPSSELYDVIFKAAIMSFWIEKDFPVPSTAWLYDQTSYMANIRENFKEQYASYVLDNIINS